MPTPIEEFQCLLREMFRFDRADLDFGIYRIMNHKRDVIEKFVSSTLPDKIADEPDKEGQLIGNALVDLEEATKYVQKELGHDAIGPDKELDKKFHGTRLGGAYLAAKKRASYMYDRTAIETNIYNHLWRFFRRCYQERDFISKRRHSERNRYAIPYNGEEVYLHWANSDQYYTAEYNFVNSRQI